MDILAARKKAAERAKAGRETQAPSEAAPKTAGLPGVPASGPVPAGHPPAPSAAAFQDLVPVPAAAIASVGASAVQPAFGVPEERDLEMLAFFLGREEYVIPVEMVREVLTLREVTPIPHAEEHILGVCSLRGAVLPVVDLTKRLRLTAGPQDEKSRIIVAALDAGDQVGLLVDRIQGVVRFRDSAIRPVPENIEKESGFLSGIARKDDRLLILLDVVKAVGMAVPER